MMLSDFHFNDTMRLPLILLGELPLNESKHLRPQVAQDVMLAQRSPMAARLSSIAFQCRGRVSIRRARHWLTSQLTTTVACPLLGRGMLAWLEAEYLILTQLTRAVIWQSC
jgi:hypothetical protein